MIRYKISDIQEQRLRIEYVTSSEFDYNNYSGYYDYVLKNVPGTLEVHYRDGVDPNWVETIFFDKEKHLAWFMLRYT